MVHPKPIEKQGVGINLPIHKIFGIEIMNSWCTLEMLHLGLISTMSVFYPQDGKEVVHQK